MITMDEALRLKQQLLGLLDEDAENQQRILERLDAVRAERGIEAHAGLMLILTGQAFDEPAARVHWEGIVHHREGMSGRIGRDVGLRVAAFDYFVNVNRRTDSPRLIDLHISDPVQPGATTDPATGLLNDHSFRLALHAEVRRARRYGPGFVVARLDLDGLGEANQRFGSLVGDALVRECALIIKGRIRDIDIAARLTGGEFALILPESDRLSGTVVCERIRRGAERFFADREAGGRVVGLTLSGGLAKHPEDGNQAEELLQRAADALYLAKSRGKNNISVFYRERRHFRRHDGEGRGLHVSLLAEPPVPGALPPARSPESERIISDAAFTNISRGGILFSSNEPQPVGREVLLELTAPDASESLTVRARVVRLEEVAGAGGESRFEIGVAFRFDGQQEEQEYLDFFERWSRSEPQR
jgi:diguanylate cyclase (GGDEF)-like protein